MEAPRFDRQHWCSSFVKLNYGAEHMYRHRNTILHIQDIYTGLHNLGIHIYMDQVRRNGTKAETIPSPKSHKYLFRYIQWHQNWQDECIQPLSLPKWQASHECQISIRNPRFHCHRNVHCHSLSNDLFQETPLVVDTIDKEWLLNPHSPCLIAAFLNMGPIHKDDEKLEPRHPGRNRNQNNLDPPGTILHFAV